MQSYPFLDTLLDSSPDEEVWVWLVQFRLGDFEAIYPVRFLGFTGHQTECRIAVVTNPSSSGYSSTAQDRDARFRSARFLTQVPVYDLYPTPEEAVKALIQEMTRTQMSQTAIREFLSLELPTPLTENSDVVAEVSSHLKKNFEELSTWDAEHEAILDAEEINENKDLFTHEVLKKEAGRMNAPIYAPLAKSPGDYAEKKLGRSLRVGDAEDPKVFAMVEAFAAGQDSELAMHLPLFESIYTSVVNRNKSLALRVKNLIERIETTQRVRGGVK